jgi:hypothetical protein
MGELGLGGWGQIGYGWHVKQDGGIEWRRFVRGSSFPKLLLKFMNNKHSFYVDEHIDEFDTMLYNRNSLTHKLKRLFIMEKFPCWMQA